MVLVRGTLMTQPTNMNKMPDIRMSSNSDLEEALISDPSGAICGK